MTTGKTLLRAFATAATAALVVACCFQTARSQTEQPSQIPTTTQTPAAPPTALPSSTQTPAPSPSPAPASSSASSSSTPVEPDLSITATVTARELRFDAVPNPTVEFTGKPRRETVWETDRENLPPSVQPGVTYRDIGTRLRITSVFADIERIVAEALGETPLTNDAPQTQSFPQTQTPAPPSHQSNASEQSTATTLTTTTLTPPPASSNVAQPAATNTTRRRNTRGERRP